MIPLLLFLLAFAAVRLDTAVLDFLSRKLLSLPMTGLIRPPDAPSPAAAILP